VRPVFDDIMATRQDRLDQQFLEGLANDPGDAAPAPGRGIKEVMAPGALDPAVKELIYLAVSIHQRLRLLAPPRTARGGPSGSA